MMKSKRAGSNITSNEYPVGYRKPPVAGQFKKGVSGNPKGRPQIKTNVFDMVRDRLFATVIVREGDRIRKMSTLDALFTKATAEAMQGRPKGFIDLLKFFEVSGLFSLRQFNEPWHGKVTVRFVRPGDSNITPSG